MAKPAGRTTVKAEVGRARTKPFRLNYLIHDVSRFWRTLFDQEMKPLDVTRSQWSALAAISRYPGQSALQIELARQLEVGKGGVGGLIDRLEASNLVERRIDPKDRRAKTIYITEKGYKVISQMEALGLLQNEVILDGIAPADLATTQATLERLRTNIRAKIAANAQAGLGSSGLNDDTA